MKKVILSLGACALLFAANLQNPQAKFEAYKTQAKTAVPGTFKDVVFELNKGGSVEEILTDANATIDFTKVDTAMPMRNANIANKLVKLLTTPQIKVNFVTVKDGDINATVTINGVSKQTPLKYEVKDGKLNAVGEIKMPDFMPDAFDSFRNDKTIAALHGKITHPEVKIIFEAEVSE